MSTRVHHAHLRSRRSIAQDTEEFVLACEDPSPLQFRPGQFISVQVGTDAQQNPVLRSYSIASHPQRQGEVVLVLRMVEEGSGSRFFRALQTGERLRFTGPMGFFVNELSHSGDVIYAATGTGIAPVLPMLTEVLQRPESGPVRLYWGLREEADLFWQAELDELLRLHPRLSTQLFLSRPSPAWTGRRGRIIEPILEALPTFTSPTFYLCGNGAMIDELKRGLQARGVDRKRQIRTEAFFD